jgi:hypothetical protein
MGEANRRKQRGGGKRARFLHLMQFLSRYSYEKIFRFSQIRKL